MPTPTYIVWLGQIYDIFYHYNGDNIIYYS